MKKGDKVLCIMDHLPEHNYIIKRGTDHKPLKFPEKGKIYTIRGLNGNNGVWLEEIINEKTFFENGAKGEVAFGTWCVELVKTPKIKLKVKIPKNEKYLCG